jgi:hypothetical protein
MKTLKKFRRWVFIGIYNAEMQASNFTECRNVADLCQTKATAPQSIAVVNKYESVCVNSGSEEQQLAHMHKARLKPKGAILPLQNSAWIMPPWVEQGWRVTIQDREEAVREIARFAASRTLGVYTDASMVEHFVGAAVVTRLESQTKVVRIAAAELAAIAMALDFARTCRQNQVTVLSDRRRRGWHRSHT